MESIKHIHKDVVITRSNDGELVVTSRQVAEDFGKQHQHVTQAIENLISENSLLKSMMMESEYTTERGRKYKEYLLTRDGFSLLVMGFTGSRALEWKLKYIEAFNKMEQAIKNPYGHLSKEVQAIFALDHKQQQLEVEVLGGKGSQAYKNNSLRGKVYADIQHELKREFQVTRYEAIKRCQLIKAREIIADYKVPFMLKDEIIRVNNQINFKDVV